MKVEGGTVLIDLTRTEEEMFGALDRHHRKNVRRGLKNDVAIVEGGDRDACYAIYRAMCRRNLVAPDPFDRVFRSKRLHRALLDGRTTAFYTLTVDPRGSAATLHRGASLPEARSGRANTVLLWEIIRHYQACGFAQLDLGGVDLHAEHTEGIDRFKLRWGGRLVRHENDAVLSEYLWWKYLRHHRAFRRLMYWKGVANVLVGRSDAALEDSHPVARHVGRSARTAG